MLYDTICEIWPCYRVYPGREVERRFVRKYPVDESYEVLLKLSRGAEDPLKLWGEEGLSAS